MIPAANTPRILIAGIGNIFFGDDAFGVEVAQRLLRRPRQEGVRVVDFGIRGLDLTYALLDSCDIAILVDAVPRGEAPGTLYVIEPEMPVMPTPSSDELNPGAIFLEAHALDPEKVLRTVVSLGGLVRRVLLVGCEPTPLADADGMQMEMSEPVQVAVGEAVALVESIVADLLSAGDPSTPPSREWIIPKGDSRHVHPQSSP